MGLIFKIPAPPINSLTTIHGGQLYTFAVNTNGVGNPLNAFPGDVITWTVTSPGSPGHTLTWWVDMNTVYDDNFVEQFPANKPIGTITLDGAGIGTFSLTVVSAPPSPNQFMMYIGDSLYQGFLGHPPVTLHA